MTWCLLTNSLPAGKFTAVNCGNVTNLKKVINDATEEKRLKMAAMYYLFLLKYSWFTILCSFQVCSIVMQLHAPAWLLSSVGFFATLWIVAHQASLSKGFPRQEYWSGLPFPPPGDLPDPRDRTSISCIAGRFFTHQAIREAHMCVCVCVCVCVFFFRLFCIIG